MRSSFSSAILLQFINAVVFAAAFPYLTNIHKTISAGGCYIARTKASLFSRVERRTTLPGDDDTVVVKKRLSESSKKKISEKKKVPRHDKMKGLLNYEEPGLEVQLEYARNGHAVFRGLLDPEVVDILRPKLLEHARKHELKAWNQKVEVALGARAANSCQSVVECRQVLARHYMCEEPPIPFLQYFNSWRFIAEVDRLVKCETMVRTAACLMNVEKVRLYQDSLFWKRNCDRPTPWHVDARMAPFDTSNMITFWIPLQDLLTHDDSALVFCSSSHNDFALPYWSPVPTDEESCDSEWYRLEERYGSDALVDYLPLRAGDVTVHSGWTLHCSDTVRHGTPDRLALAISYVDGRAPVRPDVGLDAAKTNGRSDNEDSWSFRDWVKQVPVMKRNFSHKLVPIVWPLAKAQRKWRKQGNHL